MTINDAIHLVGQRLIPLGFQRSPRKKLFIKDCGFYLIIAELAPLRKEGFHFDIGVHFLWANHDIFTYDYACDDARINAKNDPLGAVWFDDPPALREAKIAQILDDAMEKLEIYQQLTDLSVLKHRLENRNDFRKKVDPHLENRDISLAITKMYTGEVPRATQIMAQAAKQNPAAAALYPCCGDQEQFQRTLLEIVNRCRSLLAKQSRIPLAPIAKI